MMPEDEPDIPSVYQMKWTFQFVYFIVGGSFLFLSYKAVECYLQNPWGPEWQLWLVGTVFPVVGVACVLSPFVSRVVLDRDSITLKGILRDKSLPRAAITSMRAYQNDGYRYATLVAPHNRPRRLTIQLIYRFDRRWDNWTSTLHRVKSSRLFELFDWLGSGK
jgi:hypothetical protein